MISPHKLRSAVSSGEVVEWTEQTRKHKKTEGTFLESSLEAKYPIPAAKRRKTSSISNEFKSPEPAFTAPISLPTTSMPYSSVTTPISSLDRPKKKKRIPYTLVEASKGNHCPTEGCEGHGHITGLYAMHFAVSGCPKAHGKTAEECRARREELNRLRSKNLPNEGEGSGSGSGGGVVLGERSLRRTQRSSVGGASAGRGNAAGISAARKAQVSLDCFLFVCVMSIMLMCVYRLYQLQLLQWACQLPNWLVSLSCMDCWLILNL